MSVKKIAIISREVQKYDLDSNSLALGLSVAQFIPSSPIISREVQKYDLESNSLALGLSVAQFIPSSPIISREVFSDKNL